MSDVHGTDQLGQASSAAFDQGPVPEGVRTTDLDHCRRPTRSLLCSQMRCDSTLPTPAHISEWSSIGSINSGGDAGNQSGEFGIGDRGHLGIAAEARADVSAGAGVSAG